MSPSFKTHMSFGKDVEVYFFQLQTGQLVMCFEISGTSSKVFDKHRPPVVMMDGGKVIDFGDAKDIHAITMSADIPSVYYSFDPRMVSGVIWHGEGKERKGDIGALLSTASLAIKVYYSDYTEDSFQFDGNSITALQRKLADGLRL